MGLPLWFWPLPAVGASKGLVPGWFSAPSPWDRDLFLSPTLSDLHLYSGVKSHFPFPATMSFVTQGKSPGRAWLLWHSSRCSPSQACATKKGLSLASTCAQRSLWVLMNDTWKHPCVDENPLCLRHLCLNFRPSGYFTSLMGSRKWLCGLAVITLFTASFTF